MDLWFYLTTLSVVPLFAFRAFVPLFATSLVARFGAEFAPLAEVAGIQLLSELPAWATDDVTLLILGCMAGLELLLAKVPETRDLILYSDTQLKAIAAFLVCFSLVEGDPREILDHIRKEGLSLGYAWGQSFAYTWSFGIGGLVWFSATIRRGVYELLSAIDEDDSLGLVRLLSWMEDGIGFVGIMVAVFLPALALVFAAFAVLGLEGLRRALEARERKQMSPCPNCDTPCHLSAIECSNCHHRFEHPFPVGVLGVAKTGRVVDLAAHRLRLIANKRCSLCATRLAEKKLTQHCPACDAAVFPDERSLDDYLDSLSARLPKTLAVCLGFGAVPLFGLIPGILYYRVSLIASLRFYIPRTMGLFTRWIVRILNAILLLLQVVPVVGALTLPLMCWVNYSVYTAAVRRQANRSFDRVIADPVAG